MMNIRSDEFASIIHDIYARNQKELDNLRINYELEITTARDQRDQARSALAALRDEIAAKEENNGTS